MRTTITALLLVILGGIVPGPPAATVQGVASWYCGDICTAGYPSGMYAAAGRELRVGDWRGSRVTVCADGCVVVTLIDHCGCPGARVVDLYREAFDRIGDPSRGVIPVSITRAAPSLPETDTEGVEP